MGEIVGGFVHRPASEPAADSRTIARRQGQQLAGNVSDTTFRNNYYTEDGAQRVIAWRVSGQFSDEHPAPTGGPRGGGGNAA